jgi:hypothetical protein
VESRESVVEVAFDELPSSLVDIVENIDTLEAQLIGSYSNDWAVFLVKSEKSVRHPLCP